MLGGTGVPPDRSNAEDRCRRRVDRPVRAQSGAGDPVAGADRLLVLVVIGTLIRNVGPLLVACRRMAIAGWGAWWAITERMPRRAVGILGAAGVLVIGPVVAEASRRDWTGTGPRSSSWLLLALGAAVCARLAVSDLHQIDRRHVPPFRAHPSRS